MKIKTLYLDSVDSTNIFAKQNLALCESDMLLAIYSSYQTKGLGTNERAWISEKNDNLLTTLVFEYHKAHPPTQYVQVASVTILQYLESLGLQPTIKWPNDVLINDKKIAGLLALPQSDANKMLLGIGLNVNMKDFTKIDQPATSIYAETKIEYDVKTLLDALVSLFQANLTRFHEEGFDPFLHQYAEHLAFVGEHIKWNDLEGILRSVSLDGSLLFEDLKHHIHSIKSGSIMPLNREQP